MKCRFEIHGCRPQQRICSNQKHSRQHDACHPTATTLLHPSHAVAPAKESSRPNAKSNPPFPWTHHFLPESWSSYAAPPIMQYEGIITGSLVFSIPLRSVRARLQSCRKIVKNE